MKINGILLSLEYRGPRQRTKSTCKAFIGKNIQECKGKAIEYLNRFSGIFLQGDSVDCELDENMPDWFTYELCSKSRKKLLQNEIHSLNYKQKEVEA